MRNFHAEAVRIWPFNGTSHHGGRHWDRALEVAPLPRPPQCGEKSSAEMPQEAMFIPALDSSDNGTDVSLPPKII